MASRSITTARLTLVRMSRSQARRLLKPGAVADLALAEGYPTQGTMEVFDIFAGDRQDEAIGFTPWFMVRNSDGVVIGDIAYGFSEDGHSATVGYGVAPGVEGEGYATEALRAVVGHLFATTAVHQVEATTYTEHVASRRVMEKAGMEFIGHVAIEEGDAVREGVLYAIVRVV